MLKKTGYSNWIIIGPLLPATSLSFPDRQVLPVSILGIKENLSITGMDYGFIRAYRLIIALTTLAFVAHGLWITNDIASVSGVAGQRVTSNAVGLSGPAGTVSVAALSPPTGYVVANYSYSSLWWYAGVIPPAFLLLKFIPRIETMNYKF